MTRFDRINVTGRVLCISVILGLSLSLFDANAVRGTILLAAISTTAVALDIGTGVSRLWVATAEATLVGLVIGLALPGGLVLSPYLAIPPLLIGMSVGAKAVATVVVAETVALMISVASSSPPHTFSTTAAMLLPWLSTAAGVGVLGVWLREMRIGTQGLATDAAYESARRLVTQLRTVARKLSSGLDAVGIASQILSVVHERVGDAHGAVFIRTEGGVLTALAYRGPGAETTVDSQGSAIERCWTEMEPVQEAVASALSDHRNRLVLPLRAANRMIGLVVAHTAHQQPSDRTGALTSELDDLALRLDTALAFDEVRSIATLEERHRLAREIHDGVAQEIASLGYAVDDLMAGATEEHQQRKLRQLRNEVSRIVSELRLSIFDLRSEVSGGLGPALAEYVREVGARSGMTVHLTLDQAPTRLRFDIESELLRIAQEAVTNARKHANANNLWVDCRINPPEAMICIADDGTGLGEGRNDSYGLGIMRERAARIRAQLDVSEGSSQGLTSGTTVTVTLGGGSESHKAIDERGFAP